MIKIDLKKRDFYAEIARIQRDVKEIAEMEIQDRTIYTVNQLRTVTPVDQGEARDGWQYSYSRLFGVATISNEVEHIVYLNQGHSKQAPAYFIEQVLNTIGILK